MQRVLCPRLLVCGGSGGWGDIETPAGTRPFRTVPTPSVAPLLEPYNTAAAQMRQVTTQMFNVPELTTLKSSNS